MLVWNIHIKTFLIFRNRELWGLGYLRSIAFYVSFMYDSPATIYLGISKCGVKVSIGVGCCVWIGIRIRSALCMPPNFLWYGAPVHIPGTIYSVGSSCVRTGIKIIRRLMLELKWRFGEWTESSYTPTRLRTAMHGISTPSPTPVGSLEIDTLDVCTCNFCTMYCTEGRVLKGWESTTPRIFRGDTASARETITREFACAECSREFRGYSYPWREWTKRGRTREYPIFLDGVFL